MHAEPSATGKKSGDDWAVPMCDEHHRGLHGEGDEIAFWLKQGVAPLKWAWEQWKKWSGNGGGI